MSTEPTTNATGGCLCGAVRFEVQGPLRPVVYCHCEQCRRTSGNYVAATACAAGDLDLVDEEALRWYASSPEAKRGFCGICGANLFWQQNDREQISIMAGTIDAPTRLKAVAHIFAAGISDFLAIGDGLPQHEQRGPTDMTAAD